MKYVKAYTDRHGRRRHYFRRRGFPTIALPGDPGSRQFADAYTAALRNSRRKIGADQIEPGSFADMIVQYYESAAYAKLRDITKRTYRNALEKFRQEFADIPVSSITPTTAEDILAAVADRPGAQVTLRKVLNLIFKLALRRGLIKSNPLDGVKLSRKAAKGFLMWREGEIAAYEARWPRGSKERLAMALLLYTGQRRSDVVLMGRQHVKDGTIRVRQQKTGTELTIALHSALRKELDAAPKDHLTFLTTELGEPFTAAGFGNWFAKRTKLAGIAGYTAHGLRKAAARRLAEAGCTANQIMAVTGHKNLSEVTLYTKGADQQRMAAEAIARTETSNRSDGVRQKGRKRQ